MGTVLAVLGVLLFVASLAAGSDGWSLPALWHTLHDPQAELLIGQIRLPRTLGAWLTGALLGLGGAVSQGLFRNPLAEPYLLGSASGAVLGVVTVLAASSLGGLVPSMVSAAALSRSTNQSSPSIEKFGTTLSSQPGNHQFALPISTITAGTSRQRTTVASTATATPISR